MNIEDIPKPELTKNDLLERLVKGGILRSSVWDEERYEVVRNLSEDDLYMSISDLVEAVQWQHGFIHYLMLNDWYQDNPEKDDRPKPPYV